MNKNKTYTPNMNNSERGWTFFNAEGKVLGKAASEIAYKLIGKHKATYTPHINVGDKVVVTNAEKIVVTGKKMHQKVYKRHTGFPGGIKTERLEELMARKPTEAIRMAVKRMLPQNKLTKERMANLYIYSGEEHPHKAQEKKEDK